MQGLPMGEMTALLTMTSAGITIASGLTPMPCAREMQIGVNIALVAVLDMNWVKIPPIAATQRMMVV